MTLAQAILGINYSLRGIDDDAPSSGSDEWNYWLYLLNRKKNALFRDVKKNWSEDFEVQSVGTITANAALSFNLPSTYLAASGTGENSAAYVIATDGRRIDIDLIAANAIKNGEQAIYISGKNPQVLRFTDEITATDPMVGGTLYLPGHYLPADMTASTDDMPFPDDDWGVAATAAEIAFSDVTYEDKTEGLNAVANDLYSLMVGNAKPGTYGAPNKVVHSVSRRIGS